MKLSTGSFHACYRYLAAALAPVLGLALLAGPAFAGAPIAEGDARIAYWTTGDGVIVMTGTGECLHTRWWTPELAVAGCDPVAQTPVTSEAREVETVPAEPKAPPALTGRVYFDFDKFNLDATDRQTIDALISTLPTVDIGRVKLAGHADRIGTEVYNQALSQRRAASVRDYLSGQHGLTADLIDLEALGESQPAAVCSDELKWTDLVRCLQPNRRVEIELIRQ